MASFTVVCVVMLIYYASAQIQTVVQTTYGPIEGEANSMIRQFLSIPYAAPADTTRWQSPQSHKGWTSTLKTVDIPPGCPQKCTSSVPNMLG